MPEEAAQYLLDIGRRINDVLRVEPGIRLYQGAVGTVTALRGSDDARYVVKLYDRTADHHAATEYEALGRIRHHTSVPVPAPVDHGVVVGRKYRPPKALADFVKTRDRVCVFPPCRKSSAKCDIDHRRPFSRGGNTSTDNLQPLCPRHHELKHDHGWTVDQHQNGATVWTSPTGHTYENHCES